MKLDGKKSATQLLASCVNNESRIIEKVDGTYWNDYLIKHPPEAKAGEKMVDYALSYVKQGNPTLQNLVFDMNNEIVNNDVTVVAAKQESS